MKSVLLLLSLTTGLASSLPVIGYLGASVEIHCTYHQISQPKYFCRSNVNGTCTELIRTEKQDEFEVNGRYNMVNTRDGVRVIIRNLTREDEGTYRCGCVRCNESWVDGRWVEHYKRADTTTHITLTVRDGQTAVHLTGHPGETVSVTCHYPPEHKHFVKFFCRDERRADRQTVWCKSKVTLWMTYRLTTKEGRFSLTDNEKDHFTVNISRLAEDTGSYWCGVQTKREEAGGHYFSYMQQVLINVQGEGLKGSFPVIGLSGGKTTIKCDFGDRARYSDLNRYYWKPTYLCRRSGKSCTEILRLPTERQQKVEKGRFSLDRWAEIIITNLTKEDEGTYLCGQEEDFGEDLYNEVTLSVKDVAGQRFVQQTGQAGGNITVHCFYPPALKNSTKICYNQIRGISLDPNEMSKTKGRFSITDNPRDNVYSVTISNLTDWDTGIYECYVDQYITGSDSRFRSDLNQVQLNLQGLMTSFSLIGSSGGKVAFVCSSSSSNPKYLCRWSENKCTKLIRTDRLEKWENSGRFSMKFSSERQIIDVILRDLTKEDEGIYRVGIEEQSGPDSYCEVKLDVKDAMPSPKPVNLAGNRGKNASIICPYPAEYSGGLFGFGFIKEGDEKSWSIGLQPEEESTEYREFSMTNNEKNNYFTVTISNLAGKHVGTYWCGVWLREEWRTEIRFWSYPTKVMVTV